MTTRSDVIGIFGGTGFVGSSLANYFAEQDKTLKIFTRSRDHARHLWSLPNVQIITCDVYDETAIAAAMQACDVVINLAGILNEKRDDGAGFRRAHVDLTRTIIKACFAARVPRYIHMSALNAEPFAASYYLRTKSEAETAAMAANDEGLAVTVFRPSIIFGPEDDFFNRFQRLLRLTPFAFPLACAQTKLQPVYVGDVCQAFDRVLRARNSFGMRYDLAGNEVKTLLEIVRYVDSFSPKKHLIVPLGDLLSRVQAHTLEYFPGKPFSRDNLRSAREDNVCHGESGLHQLGIEPKTIAEIVPSYLGAKNERSRYYDLRTAARRLP